MANIALYEAGTTDFFSQGMGVLSDVISSTSTETASTTGNESSKLELQYPVGGFLANKLTEGRFVRVSRSIDSSDYAIFEITDTLRDDSGVITIYGTPYSDRLGRMSFENGGKFKEYHSVQVALDAAKAQMKGFPSWFQLTSDLSQAVDFTKDQPYENFSKFLEALNVKVGGNIYYGLTNIRIYSKRGTDRTDIVLRDDLNTKAIKIKTDYTKIVNRIIPLLPVKDEKGNDTQETKVGKVVESGYANKFIDYWAGTVIQVKTQDEANTYFNRTKIDRPTQTVTVDPIELDIDLSDVRLFDQISVYSSKLDFTNKLRVSERTIDNLTGEVTAFKLGDTSPSIVASIVQSNQDIFNQIKEIGNSVISANGKNQLFFGSAEPRNPHEGDLWYKEVDGESYMMVYHNGEWVEVISTKFKDLLDKQISDVLQSSKEYSDNLNTAIADEVGKIKSDTNAKLQTAKAERDNLNAKAEAIKQDVNTRLETAALDRKKLSDESKRLAKAATDHADDLFTQANTNAKTEAQNALQSANASLSNAKTDLEGDIDKAKQDAIAAAKSADGVVRKDFKESIDGVTSTISQNKIDADGKISTAQTTATNALNGLSSKVSKTDYNKKTGELDSAVSTAQQTAEQAGINLTTYKEAIDGSISKHSADILANANAIKTRVSTSDFNTKTKTMETATSTAQQTANEAKTELEAYKKTADGNISANKAEITATNKLIKEKVSQSVYDARTRSVDSKMGQFSIDMERALTQISDVTARVNDLNQINQLYNTEFSPDLQGWEDASDASSPKPYLTGVDGNVNSRLIGFKTGNTVNNTYARFLQWVSTGSDSPNISLSWESFASSDTTGKANIYLGFADSNGKIISSAQHSWINPGVGWTTLKWENISLPSGTRKIKVSFEATGGITAAYFGHPMLVFDSKIGSYVPGNYNNNARVASVEVALDGITELVKDPKNGLSAVRTLAANGQTLAIEARDKANANAKSITKVTETANGTQTTVSKMTGNVTDLVNKQTRTANQLTEEITDRKTGDSKVETSMKDLISKQITSVTEGYKSLNVQTERLFNTKITTITNQINDMGQVNLIKNSEFNPDLEGWETNTSGTIKEPYRSYWQPDTQATTVGWATQSGSTTSYSRLRQDVQLSTTPGSGHQISMSWYSYTGQTDFYNNLWLHFYDASGTSISTILTNWADRNGHNPGKQNSWNVQNKWEGIDVPDAATMVNISFEAREGTSAYLAHPMLVMGSTIGSYTPGPYNNNATVESNRLQLVNMIQDKVEDYTKKIEAVRTTTARQITDEVSDRKKGDSTVETNLSDMIDKRATSLKSGYESYFNQQSQSIIMGVGTPNRLVNTQFSPDLEGWNVTNNKVHYDSNFYRSYVWDGQTVVGVSTASYPEVETEKHYSYFEQDVPTPNNTGNVVFSMSIWSRAARNDHYTSLWFTFRDANLKQIGDGVLKYWAGSNNNWNQSKFENISVPQEAKYVRVSFQAREGTNAYLAKPMFTWTSKAAEYVPGPYSAVSEQTVLNLLKDKWSIGIADNAGRIISGINGDRSGLAIIAKKVTISQDTVVQGTSWLSGAVIKDASISRAKIGKLDVSDADIINVNVDKISGDIARFIELKARRIDAKVLYGDTGHLGTTDTGRVINKQDNHLQLASNGFYDSRNDRAQLELLNNASGISDEMKGSLNYYSNPTNKGHGLGIRMKSNQILAIDEDKGSKMLYLSPYQGGEVRVVSRDLKAYYPMRASSFNAMSSRSAKSDIVPFEDCALDIVKNTKVRTYVKNGKQEIGVISDEADPRMLTDDDNAVSLYDYTSILYKAVQELSNKVEELSK